MEKLENKIVDMRELYEEKKEQGDYTKASLSDNQQPGKVNVPFQDSPIKEQDPFFESQENHNLIGVANIFLEALFHDIKLDYHTPIISQQGEVAGRLQVISPIPIPPFYFMSTFPRRWNSVVSRELSPKTEYAKLLPTTRPTAATMKKTTAARTSPAAYTSNKPLVYLYPFLTTCFATTPSGTTPIL
mgnify:CR=1 FL=1